MTQARAAIMQIDSQRARLAESEGLLGAASEIESLQERLGAMEKAHADRATVEKLLHDSEHQSRRLLRDLGRPIDLDLADTQRLRADEPTIIRSLGQQAAKLRGQADEGIKTVARNDSEIRRLENILAQLAQPPDLEPLARAVRKAREAGDIDARLIELRSKLVVAEKKASILLAQLPGWCRPREDLERLAVPLNASLDEYESQFQGTARQRELVVERLRQIGESIRQLETRLQALELEQDVPTEEALLTARKLRQDGWELVKAAWLLGAVDQASTAAFVAQFAPGGTLAAAFERSVERVDALADRLRREAERTAYKAEWLAQLAQQRLARAALEQEAGLLDARNARIEREWKALVAPLGIASESQTPAELRAWLRRRDDVVQLFEQVDEARASIEPLELALATHLAAVSHACGEVGEPAATPSGNLAELLERADAAIDRHQAAKQQRVALETQLARSRAERGDARISLEGTETALEDWQTKWATWMARIGLESMRLPNRRRLF